MNAFHPPLSTDHDDKTHDNGIVTRPEPQIGVRSCITTFVLNVLQDVIKRYNWVSHAYCLMDNHYNLLMETVRLVSETGLSFREDTPPTQPSRTYVFLRRHLETANLILKGQSASS